MDHSAALTAALRAKAKLGNDTLDAEQVEALAGVLGLTPEQLPELVAGLAKAVPSVIELIWGGSLKVLPEAKPAGTGDTIIQNFGGATFGHGTAIAGKGDAKGGTVTVSPEAARGELAAVLVQLREALPKLTGEAAHAAAQAEQVLAQAPAASASPETRQTWTQQAASWLRDLLRAAPEFGQLAKLGEEAVKALT